MLQPERFREPVLAARIRERPEDFRVEEDLGFEPDGEGEHWLLRIEKRERDTLAVARELARFAGVAPLAVGFAGLKDRRAVAVQHFTVRAPHLAAGDWQRLERPGLRVLAAARHRRKLPRGAHRGNRFELGLRLLDGEPGAIAARIEAIARLGFPNHFGPQRFGRGGANLHEPAGIARVRGPERGMRLSAVRAALFNDLLAARIEEGSWDRLLAGDLAMLDGRGTRFRVEDPGDPALAARLAAGEIHPSGPLWGRGDPGTAGEPLALERAVAARHPEWAEILEQGGLRMDRRALRARPRALDFGFAGRERLVLRCWLPRGVFMTALLAALGPVAER